MANILIEDNAYISTSSACIVDLTPPTFAGIATLAVQSRGQIRATWAAATDSTPPIRYEVYIQASTPTGLFNTANIIASTDKLQYDTFTMPDGSFLVNGTTYYVGVRAVDAVGNRDSNVVTLNVISTGVYVSSDVYEVDGAFALNSNNQLQGTMWILKNSVLGTGPTLGTASYEIYDKTGALVPIMSESGIIADANGQFKITPVTSSLSTTLDHYLVKVTINMDSANRVGYVPLIEPIPTYDISGAFSLNTDNELTGSFWVAADNQLITNPARLGTASYQIYDVNGVAVGGMTESGITPDSNGLYEITEISSVLSTDLSLYFAKVTITVDAVPRTEILPIIGRLPEYDCKARFSINALNQFQGSFTASSNGVIKTGAGLGTANYTVYDATGAAVPGLTQTGIVADGNGRFHITPVLATLLTDLTHYSVKIGIIVDGVERSFDRGFTLLGN